MENTSSKYNALSGKEEEEEEGEAESWTPQNSCVRCADIYIA